MVAMTPKTAHMNRRKEATEYLTREGTSYRICNTLIGLGLGGVLFLLYLGDVKTSPTGKIEGATLFGNTLPATCIYRNLFGTGCPGCGLTRAVILLLDGQADKASQLHPSAIWVTLWLAAQVLIRLVFGVLGSKVLSLWVADLTVSLGSMATAIYAPIIICRVA